MTTPVVFPLRELHDTVDAVASALADRRKEADKIIGMALLALIRRAYLEKSRGGVGDDGISWEPVKVGTVLARLRKAGHLSRTKDNTPSSSAGQKRFRGATYTVKRTVKNNAKLFGRLAKAGVTFHDPRGRLITGASPRHRQGTKLRVNSKTRKQTIPSLSGTASIGIQTGAQLNSANPGFQGPDGLGNIFKQDETSFTVGFGRDYSVSFDRQRTLIPESLPEAWQPELEQLTTEHQVKIVETLFQEKGIS